MRGILEELDRKPFEPEQIRAHAEALVDYAVRHDLQPLTGIVPLLDKPSPLRDVTRARAALDLNDVNAATRIEIGSTATSSPEWEAYLLDRALFEARHRNTTTANGYLARAATLSPSVWRGPRAIATRSARG